MCRKILMISVPTEKGEPMAEYIDKTLLLSDIDAAVNNNGMGYVIGQTLKRYVKRQPSADVAPVRHGRWVSWEDAGNFIPSPDRHECSVCHDAAQVLVNGIELLSPYCPN